MIRKVKVIILRTAGTNCDRETKFAFESLGGEVDCLHINKFLNREKTIKDYHILVVPGGFTYGDDIAAGKILANELRLKLGDDIKEFILEGKPVIGICNGFQILVKAGLLPGIKFDRQSHQEFSQTATLMTNESGRFEDRWVYLKPNGRCIWVKGIDRIISLPVAHGEGKFVPKDKGVLERLKKNEQIVFHYCNELGRRPTYPENPNGSVDDIAGICDESGLVFGLMPHPERHFVFTQNPHWTRLKKKTKYGDGAMIFENGIRYAREKLL
jgi:phosphoribosylformylglycinamidine synthase